MPPAPDPYLADLLTAEAELRRHLKNPEPGSRNWRAVLSDRIHEVQRCFTSFLLFGPPPEPAAPEVLVSTRPDS